MAEAFIRRGYPESLVFTSLVRARRVDRNSLLVEMELKKTKNDSVFLIQTFTPGNNVLGCIVNRNIDHIKNPNFRDFNNIQIIGAFRKS